MGLRFRKSLRIVPGLKVNFSKQGLSSLTVGGKGLTYNIGRKGTRGTAGLPGTGLSYSHYTPHETTGDGAQGQARSSAVPGWLGPVCIALIIGAVYFLRG